MKRSTALILWTFFDIFGFVIMYFFVYQPLSNIFAAIANRVESIEYNATFFLGFSSVFIPTMHVIGLIETYLPRYFNRSVCTKVMWCSVIVPLVIGLGTAQWVKQEILQNGYVHCEGADTHMKLAHFKVYVREMNICRQLTMEKENHRSASIR